MAFVLILSNALFGHNVFEATYGQSINKYDIYIHLQEDDWNSYPANILYDVVIVWNDDDNNENVHYYHDDYSLDDSIKLDSKNHNYNELQYIDNRSYVELKHEFSDCEKRWSPILYLYALDIIANKFEYIQGKEINGDPYTPQYVNVKNDRYSDNQQSLKLQTGYVQFIPICASNDISNYNFSVKINDDNVGVDVYFVDSIQQLFNYVNDQENFEYYDDGTCHRINYQSLSGNCKNVSKDSGLLVAIPDELSLSLTRITVNLYEVEE